MLKQKQVQQIATLAKLNISDTKTIVTELSNILNIANDLQSIDTTGVIPMSNALDMTQRLRADEILEVNNRKLNQSICEYTQNGYYLVPKVL